MNRSLLGVFGVTALALAWSTGAVAQSRVQYGRITNVQATTVTDNTSRTVGTLVGGGIGLATGSGQSGSNRAPARDRRGGSRTRGIHVNVVAPGLVETEMGRRLVKAGGVDDIGTLQSAAMPFGRVCQPQDVANLVRFFVSDAGSYLSGQRVVVDGGGAGQR